MLGLSERERALAKDDELTRMLDDAGKPPRDPAKLQKCLSPLEYSPHVSAVKPPGSPSRFR